MSSRYHPFGAFQFTKYLKAKILAKTVDIDLLMVSPSPNYFLSHSFAKHVLKNVI